MSGGLTLTWRRTGPRMRKCVCGRCRWWTGAHWLNPLSTWQAKWPSPRASRRFRSVAIRIRAAGQQTAEGPLGRCGKEEKVTWEGFLILWRIRWWVLQNVERKFQIYAVFDKIPVIFKETEQLCTIQGLFRIPCDLGLLPIVMKSSFWTTDTWSQFIWQKSWHNTTTLFTCTAHASLELLYFILDRLYAKRLVFYCYRFVDLLICYSWDSLLHILVWTTVICYVCSLPLQNLRIKIFRSKVVSAGSGATFFDGHMWNLLLLLGAKHFYPLISYCWS